MSSTTNPQATPEREPDIAGILDRIGKGSRDSSDLGDLSDPSREQFVTLIERWGVLPVDARRFVLRELNQKVEENLELNFARLLRHAMNDEDAEVRALAIAGLWEDTSVSLLLALCDTCRREDDPAVQEAVATALERYSMMASTGDLADEHVMCVREALLGLLGGAHAWMVRRRALESLSYLPGDREINEEIERAAESANERIQAGAIAAMGRNLDPRWFGRVLSALGDEDPDIRFEATRAAGQYEDLRAVPALLELLEDEDDEIRLAAIESLGFIGGDQATSALEDLEQSEDSTVRDAAGRALSEARFASGNEGYPG